MEIYPSIFVDDYQEFEKRVNLIQNEASLLHIDVADGEFVGHKSFQDIEKIKKFPFAKPFELHLMIARPEQTIATWLGLPAQRLVVHYEALNNPSALEGLIRQITQAGKQCGLAINPETLVEVLSPFLRDIDLVLVMSVKPGFSGQEFMPSILDKLSTLSEKKFSGIIEVDGGMNARTIPLVARNGASAVAVTHAIFDSSNPRLALQELIQQFSH